MREDTQFPVLITKYSRWFPRFFRVHELDELSEFKDFGDIQMVRMTVFLKWWVPKIIETLRINGYRKADRIITNASKTGS